MDDLEDALLGRFDVFAQTELARSAAMHRLAQEGRQEVRTGSENGAIDAIGAGAEIVGRGDGGEVAGVV